MALDMKPSAAKAQGSQITQGRRLCLFANCKSGRGADDQRLSEIVAGLKQRGIDPDLRQLSKGDNFAEITREVLRDGADTILVAGGDGTMSGVAEAVMGTDAAMGVVPMGTFNYFARSLGVPEDLDGALDVIAEGHKRQTNVATMNDRLFLNNASLGIYPQILKTRETTYARWGRSRIAAYWSVLVTMMRLSPPLTLDITADGHQETLTTPLLFTVSNAFQLREMGLEGAECVEQGQLALLVAKNSGRLGLMRQGGTLLLGLAEEDRDFRLICASSVVLKTRGTSLRVARDGERERMSGPFEIRMRTGALRVIAPPGSTQDVR